MTESELRIKFEELFSYLDLSKYAYGENEYINTMTATCYSGFFAHAVLVNPLEVEVKVKVKSIKDMREYFNKVCSWSFPLEEDAPEDLEELDLETFWQGWLYCAQANKFLGEKQPYFKRYLAQKTKEEVY